ncbi:MAG: aminotransferase class IV, partial [Verrucomicrobiales bacterium]
DAGLDLAAAGAAMGELLVRNGMAEGRCRIRLAVSGGDGGPGDLARGKGALVWMCAGAVGAAGEARLRVTVSRWTRNERSAVAGLKCDSYAENVVALDAARRAGFDEALFFNSAGQLCEAATANVFLVRDGVLLTPDLSCGCLPGVTRGVVLECAARLGIPWREGELGAGDLEAADEVFLTSATRGPVAVGGVDGRDYAAGELTGRLREAWEREIRR